MVSPEVSNTWKKNNERMLQNFRNGKMAQDAINSMKQNKNQQQTKKKTSVGQALKYALK